MYLIPWRVQASGSLSDANIHDNIITEHVSNFDVGSRVNSFPPGQEGGRFADNIFRGILVNEKSFILIKISLKCVPYGPIDNNPALVLIMAWRRIGDKLLSEPMPN